MEVMVAAVSLPYCCLNMVSSCTPRMALTRLLLAWEMMFSIRCRYRVGASSTTSPTGMLPRVLTSLVMRLTTTE